MGPELVENDTFLLERTLIGQGYPMVAGIDEAGRGPLAGPVVAACVILPVSSDYRAFKDSKKLSPAVRKKLCRILERNGALIGVGRVSEFDIDRLNILQATLLAMKRAVLNLRDAPDFLLVDGTFPVPVNIPQKTLIKGESRSASIAAASIIAKVTRDELMESYHRQYPGYNFHKHKGYPTREHRRLIKKLGPCEIHRRSFKGVREYLPGPKMKPRFSLGKRGEVLARDYLEGLGYRILTQNYRTRSGEIDLIAEDAGSLVFIEVKTRTRLSHGWPLESVTPAKRRRISMAALEYLGRNDFHDRPARFDAVSVLVRGNKPARIELVKDAFELCYGT